MPRILNRNAVQGLKLCTAFYYHSSLANAKPRLYNPLKRLSTQLLDISIYAMKHTWNIDALRTVRFALTTTYTMVGLTDSRDSAVVAYEVPALQALEILLLVTLGDITRIHCIVVVAENRRDVDTVRTWHTISTASARNSRVVLH